MDGIEVRVECADALKHPVELLVLKYAQALYGADRAAAAALGLHGGLMPAVDRHLLVDGRPATGAASVLFLGVRALDTFNYGDVRRFAEHALAVAREVRPHVRDIALTLHGGGFGLDEIEAFNAEVGGLLDAVGAREFPQGLRRVTFLERNDRLAERMRLALRELVPGQRIEVVDPRAEERLRDTGDASGQRGHAFVAMPFSNDFEDAFHFGISPAVRATGLLCVRIDKHTFVGDIVQQMQEKIRTAKLMVADLTGANPNVYLEVGYAWGNDVPTILLCRDAANLEFDVKGQRCLVYTSIRDLETQLAKEIRDLVQAPHR